MPKIETTELKTVLCPIWAPAKDIRHLFGVSAPTLSRMVDDGIVRRKKTGDKKQNGAVYSVSDVNDWFEGGES